MRRLACRFLFLVLCLCTVVRAADSRPKLVLLVAEPEYETVKSLPAFAARFLEKDFRVALVSGSTTPGENAFDRPQEIADADVLLVSVRRRTPPVAQLELIRRHVAAGKALVGIRTASHAFALRGDQKPAEGLAAWPEFDAAALGGHYTNHHGRDAITQVTAAEGDTVHPILRGVQLPFTSTAALYKTSPLSTKAEALLMGAIPGQSAEPVAWTFRNNGAGRTFYTSLGNPADFANPSFQQLLRNGILWAAGLLGGSDAASAAPRTYYYDLKNLAAARTRLAQQDPALLPALEQLRADAERALQMKPVSVMDKTRTPPSGDKHDYVSQAPYWWPDPKKPDGLPYIRRDGDRNPEVDRGTDRAAFGRVQGAVSTLALAYYFTGHEPYAAHAAQLLRTWFLDPATRMNPHLEFGQYIPGINQGRGIGIIETAHLGRMCDGVALLAGSPAWTAADARNFRAWLAAYFDWLTTSSHGLDEADEENNHGTWYDAQAAHLALMLGRQDFARQMLATGLKKRIELEIEPDGAQPRELARTKSLSYSTMNLDAMFTNARLAEQLGIDWWNHAGAEGRSLRAALRYIAPYADPAKRWPKDDLIEGGRDAIVALLADASRRWDDAEFQAILAAQAARPEQKSARWRLLLNAP